MQATWKFFYDRIPFEEAYLVDFFGVEYVKYAQHAIIGIPFIRPYEALLGFRGPSALTRNSSSAQPRPSEFNGPTNPTLRRT